MEPVRLADDVVRLAAPTADDVDAIEALCQDPDVQRWTTVPSPYTRADAESFVGAWVTAGWAAGRECTWGIRTADRTADRSDDETADETPDQTADALVGMVGLRLQPERSAEVGYWLGRDARGRGLLHRSLHLVLGYAFDPAGLDLDRVEWHCVAGNWASWRAAWRVGFTFEGAVRGASLIRGRREDDWVATLLRADPREPSAPWPATTVRVPVAPPDAAPHR